MDFAKQLKKCQHEKHMSGEAFAKYIGKSRTWLQQIYSTNANVEKHALYELTMYELNEKLGIPYEVMEEYNTSVVNMRKGTDI